MNETRKPKKAPLTVDLDATSLARIEELRASGRYKSTSDVIREVLSRVDFAKFDAGKEERKQISFRIDAELRDKLSKAAKQEGVSFGHLLRTSLLAYEGIESAEQAPPSPKSYASAPAKANDRASTSAPVSIFESEYNGTTLLAFSTPTRSFSLDQEQLEILESSWKDICDFLETRRSMSKLPIEDGCSRHDHTGQTTSDSPEDAKTNEVENGDEFWKI